MLRSLMTQFDRTVCCDSVFLEESDEYISVIKPGTPNLVS